MTSSRTASIRENAFLLVPPIFYFYTMCRTIGFGDTALLINDMMRLGLSSHVNNHPFTVLTGWLFIHLLPFSELAYRANFVSAVYGSVAICAFYLLLREEFRSLRTAVFGSVLLMLCHSMWWHSTIVENYAASAFLTACLLLWRKFERTKNESWLYGLCAVAGFSLFNHIQMGFVCVGVLVTALLHANRSGHWGRTVGRCAVAAACGMLPWLLLVVRDAAGTGSFEIALQGALVGRFSGTFFSGSLWPSLYDTAYLFWYQSPACYLLAFGLVGIGIAFHREKNTVSLWGMLTAFLLNTVTFAFYPTWDKFAFLLQSFVILHYFAAWALDCAFEVSKSRRAMQGLLWIYLGVAVVLPPWLYANLATWGLDAESVWHWRYNNLYAANAYFQSEFIVNPDKHNFREVASFASKLFERLPRNAVFLDDDSRTYYPLADYFQKYYHQRPEVSVVLVNSWGMEDWGLSKAAMTKMIVDAYRQDLPFFAISLGNPLADFIRAAMREVPRLAFVKFPLDDHTWVYRLVTQREYAARALSTPILPEDIRAGEIAGLAGYIDLDERHIAFLDNAQPLQQDMKSFIGSWHADDQLFFSTDKLGAGADFVLHTNAAVRADLTFHFTAAPDYAIVQVELFPSGATGQVNLYSPTVEPRELTLRDVDLAAGANRVRIRMVDKARESSGLKFGVDGIEYAVSRR